MRKSHVVADLLKKRAQLQAALEYHSRHAAEDRARLFLKAEIKRANMIYEELAERLKEHGFNENGPSIANKLTRGTFSVTFFLAVLAAIGVAAVALDDL